MMIKLINQKRSSQQNKHLFKDSNHILSMRSLEKNHERLSELLQPGMSVLDIGCGPGSITRGIAARVVPDGKVIGVDINHSLIEEAGHNYRHISNLTFETGNIYNLPFSQQFDLVIAARILHWLDRPCEALEMIKRYLKPGGIVIAYEPNFEKLVWQPNPPDSVKVFYDAFLEWRIKMQMDNTIADKLSKMFKNAGFINVVQTPQHEIVNSTDLNFETSIGIWEDIMIIHGSQIVKNGLISEQQMMQARVDYHKWVLNSALHQTVYFNAVDAITPE
ncbi:MAG: methyltransferase domain-containing protein [Cyanobacteria bacterium J06621_8]